MIFFDWVDNGLSIYEGFSVDVCQKPVDDIIVLFLKLFELLNTNICVLMLLSLVFLQGRFCLINLSCESIVWNQYKLLNDLVVFLEEFSNSFRVACIKRIKSVGESSLLFDDPSEPTFFYEDSGSEFWKKGGIQFMEAFWDLQIFGKETVPVSITFAEKFLSCKLSSLYDGEST